jgi:uncharacterized membrane protein
MGGLLPTMKYETYSEYDPRHTALAESAFLTVLGSGSLPTEDVKKFERRLSSEEMKSLKKLNAIKTHKRRIQQFSPTLGFTLCEFAKTMGNHFGNYGLP